MLSILVQYQNGKIKHLEITKAKEMYFDWVNNFLTVAAFADYYGLTFYTSNTLINRLRYMIDNKIIN